MPIKDEHSDENDFFKLPHCVHELDLSSFTNSSAEKNSSKLRTSPA